MKVTNIKSLVAVLMLLLMSSSVLAQQVSESEAKTKAMEFFSNGAKKLPAKNGIKRQTPAVHDVKLAYTSVKDGKACFYVFNNGDDGGFVIVGGDEVAKEILAYVPQGHFDYEKAPASVKWWLGQYETEISSNVDLHPKKQFPESALSGMSDIPEMISTKWGQGEYYNNNIPLMNGEHPLTGCVATAIAQIMKYWNYPLSGSGSVENGVYSVNFESAIYDWSNMRDSYNEGTSSTEIDAVSQLMYHVGASLGDCYTYGLNSTGYQDFIKSEYKITLQRSLEEHFRYSENMRHLVRNGVCNEDWECIVYSELSAGRPVYYAGSKGIEGHAFVCHGYSSALGMFAFNWGWEGYYDGFYTLSSTDGINGYTKDQYILTGFEPEGRQHINQIEYGDSFFADGNYYAIHNPILKRAAFSPNLSNGYAGDVVIHSSVVYKDETFEVTHVDQSAFSNLSEYNYDVKSVTLPNTIMSLGNSALAGACAVKEIELPSGLQIIGDYCFYLCRELESITIPEGVNIINENCFNGCSALKSIDLPEYMTFLAQGCFGNCNSLRELTIPNGIKYLLDIYYTYESGELYKITLPSTIELINDYSFSSCSKLSYLYCNSVDVPKVWAHTFPPCIKDGVLFVPQSAIEAYRNAEFWRDWGSIEAIETAEETHYIGESFEVDGIQYYVRNKGVMVEKCIERKTEIIIPQSVEYKGEQFDILQIGQRAFLNRNIDENDVIEFVVLPEGLKIIEDAAFSNCFHLKHINFPESLVEIGSAFSACWELDNVIIPSHIKTINRDTFAHCLNLKNIHLGDSLEVIESLAFWGCNSLNKVVIPHSILYLAEYSFEDCMNLTEMYSFSPKIYSYQDWMTTFYPGEFVYDRSGAIASNQASATLYVPEEYLSNYEGYSIWQDWNDILPMVPLAAISLDQSEFELIEGQIETLNVSVTPLDATVTHCIWTSSDPTIASVNYNGDVTAHKEGIATITAISMYYPEISSSCEVRVYIRGDVNSDSSVNTTDAVCIINDRLGYESANFIRTRSDVNRDEQYTITDAVAVLNIMYGEPVGANAAPRKVQSQEESLGLSMMDNNTIALDLNCANGYTAFQFDVELPEGVKLNAITLNENRCKDFAVRFNKVDNTYKVVAYNLSNEPLSIGSDNLLTLKLSGTNESDEVRLTNIHFSTLKAVDVLFDDLSLSMTTGIQSHTISSDGAEYNVAGLRVTKDYRGIVIVNGKKVIRK